MSEHTPLPWTTHPDETGNWIVDANHDRRVAYVGHESSPTAAGDAALIVRAVNAHAALVAALEDIEEQFRKWWPGCLECECEEGRECLLCHGRLVLEQARAALALARGEVQP